MSQKTNAEFHPTTCCARPQPVASKQWSEQRKTKAAPVIEVDVAPGPRRLWEFFRYRLLFVQVLEPGLRRPAVSGTECITRKNIDLTCKLLNNAYEATPLLRPFASRPAGVLPPLLACCLTGVLFPTLPSNAQIATYEFFGAN